MLALALLALGSALLAGASAAARRATRGQATLEAAIAAESEARVVMAEAVGAWSAAIDSLPLGGMVVQGIGPRLRGFGGMEVRSSVRIQKVGPSRFVVAVSTSAGPGSARRARRRLTLVVERRASADSTVPILPLAPIRRWSVADVF